MVMNGEERKSKGKAMKRIEKCSHGCAWMRMAMEKRRLVGQRSRHEPRGNGMARR